MSTQPDINRVGLFIVVIAASFFVFFVLSFRYVPAVLYTYSPPICGPIKDQYGNVVRDAGPCPSPPPIPPGVEAHWEWAAFWIPRD